MNENFRILIAYDGSSDADAALDDLKNAGLNEKTVEASIISVAEVWLPPQNGTGEEVEFITEGLRKKYEERLEVLDETREMSRRAAERLNAMFPGWQVSADATYGSPAWEILFRAGDYKPDLIVVGAKGQTAFERVLIGSVSQKIVTEAKCSVRVARGKVEVEPSPTRIVIGYDGTDGANEVIEAVAGRKWSEGSEAKVIIVEDAASIRSSLEIENERIREVGGQVVEKLRLRGLNTSLAAREGNPKQVIVEEAEGWGADSIFIGATKFSGFFTKYLLGSVSSAIVTRAHCSVEVVRPNYYRQTG
ncbi:MAG TPA: universal stress protein [Pyrinomonadaceae bacterium]|nr:universal stress protein [Pyrinomonadaceae bacterium]